jgi:cytochrome c-type biogenesis protein CcmH
MASENRISRIGNIAFAVAGIAAVAAVGYAVHRNRAGATTTAAVASEAKSAAAPAADPEQQVRDRPQDASAWRALGESRMGSADYGGAVDAFRRATGLDSGNAEGWSALGEALVMASKHDPMPAEALAAFRKAVAIDASDPRARYFLAVDKDLAGDHKGAIDAWLALLEDTPDGAPWEADLVRTIEQVGKINAIPVADRIAAAKPTAHPALPDDSIAAAAIPGPSAEQMHAAAALSPQQQDAMVDGMVSSLEGKLAADPSNVAGWVMLMRSRMTLNQPAKAAKALKDAIAANPGNAQRLKAEAAVLNVPAM